MPKEYDFNAKKIEYFIKGCYNCSDIIIGGNMSETKNKSGCQTKEINEILNHQSMKTAKRVEELLKLKPIVEVFKNDQCCPRGQHVYAIQIVGTDFWLSSFETEKDAIQFCQDNALPIKKQQTDWIVVKKSRNAKTPYSGVSCQQAGVAPGKIYDNLNEAEKDAKKLSSVNPVGFKVESILK